MYDVIQTIQAAAVKMYASTAKLAFKSVLTSKLFDFNFVIHFMHVIRSYL